MLEPNKFLEDLGARLSAIIAASPAADLEKNARTLLASGFAKLDLVSREEFDIQTQVLQRTREKLKALEPSPYEFRFKFDDATGPHDYANGDWEAHAMFFNGRQREGNDQATLDWMSKTFNETYPRKGMLFCVGNMASRRQTWQLLGVLRVDDTGQSALF